jgi:hypothetical protein
MLCMEETGEAMGGRAAGHTRRRALALLVYRRVRRAPCWLQRAAVVSDGRIEDGK